MKVTSVREKQTNFRSVLQSFWQPDKQEILVESAIQEAEGLSERDVKLLLKSLEDTDTLAKRTFNYSNKMVRSKRKNTEKLDDGNLKSSGRENIKAERTLKKKGIVEKNFERDYRE